MKEQKNAPFKGKPIISKDAWMDTVLHKVRQKPTLSLTEITEQSQILRERGRGGGISIE